MIDSMSVGDLELRPIVPVHTEHELLHAVALMDERKTSCLVVLRDRRPAGVLTKQDIMRSAGRTPDYTQTKVSDAMSEPCVTVTKGTPALDACRRMAESRSSHLLVREDQQGKAAGMLHLSTLVDLLVMEFFCSNTSCSAIMNQEVARVRPKASLRESMMLMEAGGAGCVLVVESDKPVGILTQSDVARLMLGSKSAQALAKEQVSRYMTRPVVTAPEDALVYEVAMHQKQKNLRRTALVDEKKRLTGLLSEIDILLGFHSIFSMAETVKDMDRAPCAFDRKKAPAPSAGAKKKNAQALR
jgi:CBS domain-containing protein